MTTRPRAGRLLCPHGRDSIELRFVQMSEPGEFLAVSVDGERVTAHSGDTTEIDALGSGQKIVFQVDDPRRP